jgi:hypothetical protein
VTEIEIVRKISDPLIQKQLWEIYKQSFTGSELRCAQNQKCYSEEDFKEALEDPDYFKYYLTSDGQIIAYMLSTNNLKKASITYMNPEKYLSQFPKFSPDKIYYCTSLAVLPGKRSQRFFYQLMSVYLENVLVRLKGMHAFDFSHETIPNLPEVLVKMGKKLSVANLMPEFEYVKVGAQEFGALTPKDKSA